MYVVLMVLQEDDVLLLTFLNDVVLASLRVFRNSKLPPRGAPK